jgi:hypothetical protein
VFFEIMIKLIEAEKTNDCQERRNKTIGIKDSAYLPYKGE